MKFALPKTRSEWAYVRLSAGIYNGEFQPGEQLVASDLAALLGISTTPLREALQRLAGEDLIELAPQGTARVTHISVEVMLDLYRLRLVVEPLAVRLSVQHANQAWRDAVQDSYDRLLKEDFIVDAYNWEVAHFDFHASLIMNCPSAALIESSNALRARTRRHRLLTAGKGSALANEVDREHAALCRVALEGDSSEAASQSSSHLLTTVNAMAESKGGISAGFVRTVNEVVAPALALAWIAES